MLLLCWSFAGHAQTITVPLGQAASFGLLSGGNIVADTAAPVQVSGAVGTAGSLTGPIQADSGLYRPSGPTATTALSDLAAARAYCSGLSSQALTNLNGQTLSGSGSWTLNGNTTFGSAPLRLQGSATDVVVLNITGHLTLQANAFVRLKGILPQHVFWNVDGKVRTTGSVMIPGVVLATDSITIKGAWNGRAALQTAGAIRFQSLMALLAPTRFINSPKAPLGSIPVAPVPAPTTFDPCANLVANSALEAGTPRAQISPWSWNPVGSGPEWWFSANAASPDYFRATSANPQLSVPTNYVTQNAQFGQQRAGGQGYAGILNMSSASLGTNYPDGFREFIAQEWEQYGLGWQTPSPAGQSNDYYVEFYSRLAEASTRTMPRLGAYIGNVANMPFWTGASQNNNGVVRDQAGNTLVPQIQRNDGHLNATDRWSRTAGCLLASGAYDPVSQVYQESTIIIGSFVAETDPAAYGPSPFTQNWPYPDPFYGRGAAYYLIDDVNVVAFPTAGPNQTVSCTASVTLGAGCDLPVSSGATYTWEFFAPGATVSTPVVINAPTHVLVLNGSTAALTPRTGTYRLTVRVLDVAGDPNQTYQSQAPLNIRECQLTVSGGSALTLNTNGGCGAQTLTVSGGPTGATYIWTGPNGAPITGVTGTTCPAPVAGTYTVQVQNNPCYAPASLAVTITTTQSVTISGDESICPGGSTTLVANAPWAAGDPNATYAWTVSPWPSTTRTPVGTNSATLGPITTVSSTLYDDYIVTVTAYGCTGSALFRVRRYFDFDAVNNTTTIVGSNGVPTTWTGRIRVRGQVVVPKGVTLTIDDAIVEFADTRQTLASVTPTGILVKKSDVQSVAGGTLIIKNSTLKPLEPNNCNLLADMWDGIIVEGNPDAPQTGATSRQGSVNIQTSDIRDARCGILAGEVSYAPTTRLITPLTGGGGGMIYANNADFFDCYTGVYFAPYQYRDPNDPASVPTNVATFIGCTFKGEKFLADNIYATVSGGITRRYGMFQGVYLNSVYDVTFKACTFQGFLAPRHFERGTGIYAVAASFRAEAADGGYSTALPEFPNEGWTSGPCRFSQFYMGIYAASPAGYAAMVVKGCDFSNNWRGLVLNGVAAAKIRGNTFDVGTANGLRTNPNGTQTQEAAPLEQAGLVIESCGGVDPEANVFTRTLRTGTTNICHGVVFSNTAPNPIHLYRNLFKSTQAAPLYSGFSPRYYNENATFRCNGFGIPLNPLLSNPPAREDFFSAADVFVIGIGTVGAQGRCDPDPNALISATSANNSFNTRGRTRMRLHTDAGNLSYAYSNDADMQAVNLIDASNQGVFNLQACLKPARDQQTGEIQGCAPNPQRPLSVLRGLLAVTPPGADRNLLINQWLDASLNDTLLTGGLDSAIARLQAENNSVYQLTLNRLLARKGQYGASNRAAASPTKPGTAARSTTANYAQRVLDVLVGLGTDSARAVALTTDPALRAEVFQMAADSLTPGSQAARVALNQYAGTRYVEWIVTEELPQELTRGGANSTITAAHHADLPGRLRLVPNPTDGPLRVEYATPEAARVELVVYDSWGREVARRPLAATAAEQDVTLRLRGGLYQCVLLADGVLVARERLLINR